MTGADQERRLQQLGLIPSKPAPQPLAVNIDPSPRGAIEAIYVHPEAQLDCEPELYRIWWEWKNMSKEAGWSIQALNQLSGFEFDVLCTASGTYTRLLQWQRESKNGER